MGITWLCHSEGQSWSLSCFPNVDSNGALSIGGVSTDTLYQQRAMIQAIIPSATTNGAVTVTAQSGTSTLTSVNRTSTGVYAITWSPAAPNINYLAQGNTRTKPGFISFSGTTTTGCNILVYNAAGALADVTFHIMIFRMP